MDITARQISKDQRWLEQHINQLDPTDIHRILNATIVEYTFLSVQVTFSRIDFQIVGEEVKLSVCR